VIQYRNQVERRHWDIVQLKIQIASELAALQRIAASQWINTELIEIELHRVLDSSTYTVKPPEADPVFKTLSVVKSDIDGFLKHYEQLDTQKENRSKTLLELQSFISLLSKWKPKVQTGEQQQLSLIAKLRERRSKPLTCVQNPRSVS